VTGLIMIFGSQWVSSWYTQDQGVLILAGQLIVLAGIFQFSDITQVVSAGVLRGYKVTRVPMMIHMTAFWIIGMPLGYLLTFGTTHYDGLGVRGYWIALIIALTFTALSLQFLFRRTSRKLFLQQQRLNMSEK
jgi:MATE family multidrug resistance protein